MSVRTKDKHIPVHMGGRYTKHPPKKTTLDVFANPGRPTKKESASRSLRSSLYVCLTEVSLQQTLECLAVSCFVAGHFVSVLRTLWELRKLELLKFQGVQEILSLFNFTHNVKIYEHL